MRVKLVHAYAKAPFRANPTDAGADLYATDYMIITPNNHYLMDIGIQVEIPDGYVGLLFARSGLATEHGVRPRNCVGVVDSKYRGNIKVMLENASNKDVAIKRGDRVAQLVILPILTPKFEIVDNLDMTDDRGGGFGHTGK